MKKKLAILVAFGSLMATIGFLFVYNSGKLGISRADNWLIQQGGAETSIYQFIMNAYTNSFLAAGSILFTIGLVTIIFICYKFFTHNEMN